MSVSGHLEAAAGYIAVAESGDAKREAYAKAADEILAAKAEDPKLSNVAVGRWPSINKDEKWVREVLSWRTDGSDARPTPFARDDWEHRKQSLQRQMPSSHQDRVEMAEKLLADPKVAKAAAKTVLNESTLAGRLLASEVRDRDTEQKRKYAEATQQSREDKALPLPAYMASMVVKMNDWSAGLAALVDDLDELPEGRGRELVTIAARGLVEQAQRWVDRLEPKPELRVIEGRSRAAS